MDAGFPRGADGKPAAEYLQRGKENFVKVSWDEIFDITAKGLINIATTYSGDNGKSLLTQQGYDPAMIEAMKGAGGPDLKVPGRNASFRDNPAPGDVSHRKLYGYFGFPYPRALG